MKKLGVIFPGQGSQKVGMLAGVNSAIVKPLFDEASTILGYDLLNLVNEGPTEKLNQTIYTQPAMLAADIVFWQAWISQHNTLPLVMAGHSLGEYSAFVASGVLSFADGIRLVAKRAALMQEAVPESEGAMAAVLGLDLESITELCQTCSNEIDQVNAANINAPGQIVVAGKRDVVEKFMQVAKEAGAKKVVILPMSVPSHSYLMKPAADKLADFMETITFDQPKIPVINNVDAKVEHSVERIKEALVRQLYSPVRWVDVIHAMVNLQVEQIVECGPNRILTGLTKRIATTEVVALSVNINSEVE